MSTGVFKVLQSYVYFRVVSNFPGVFSACFIITAEDNSSYKGFVYLIVKKMTIKWLHTIL